MTVRDWLIAIGTSAALIAACAAAYALGAGLAHG